MGFTYNFLSFKVEYILPSRDMKARKVAISYKHDTEDGSRKMTIVERPVRQVVKLGDIEDTSLLDDITAVRNAAKKIIDDRSIVPETLPDSIQKEDLEKYVKMKWRKLRNKTLLNLKLMMHKVR